MCGQTFQFLWFEVSCFCQHWGLFSIKVWNPMPHSSDRQVETHWTNSSITRILGKPYLTGSLTSGPIHDTEIFASVKILTMLMNFFFCFFRQHHKDLVGNRHTLVMLGNGISCAVHAGIPPTEVCTRCDQLLCAECDTAACMGNKTRSVRQLRPTSNYAFEHHFIYMALD